MKIPIAVPVLLISTFLAVSPATAQTCGDNIRDAGEQCDDGNDHNLDGCNASCQFEQTHKIIALNIQRTLNSCPANRFGSSFTPAGVSPTNAGIDASIEAGTTAILLHFLDLEDPAADDDLDGLEVGIVNSTPVLSGPAAIGYDGNAATDLDWWYTPDGTLLDTERLPANRLTGSLTGGALTTAAGHAEVKLVISGGSASLSLSSLVLTAAIGADTTPLPSSGFPPGHLAEERLDPALQSFATAGDGATGTLCGNIGAQSMANTPIPLTLIPTCVVQAYTPANTLLDLFVSGCTTMIGPFPIAVISPAQPDQQDPGVPPAGAGHPYTLTPDPSTKAVNACTATGGGSVPLADCLADAAYSSHFKFTSQRVIARDDLIFTAGFETVI